MKHRLISPLALGLFLGMACSSGAHAQLIEASPDWKESAVPPPPAFDVGKLVPFDGAASSSLAYGVDPASIQISKSDGVVRYVVVASSASGTRNVMYDAIRCSTAQFKTYARYSEDGGWRMVSAPEWRSLSDKATPSYALRFARAGACDNASAPESAADLVARLKKSNTPNSPN